MFNISSIAKAATGSISGFRQVLNTQPSLSTFVLPPQVQAGVKIASLLGVKLPTPEQLIQDVYKSTQDIRRDVDKVLVGLEGTITKVPTDKTVSTVINSIDWLLG